MGSWDLPHTLIRCVFTFACNYPMQMNPAVSLMFFLFFGAIDGCLFASCLNKVR